MWMGARIVTGIFLAGILLWAHTAGATERVAFVVGNSEYQHAVALPNPKNDAGDIAIVLKSLDFEVIEGTDLNRTEMEEAIRRFAQAAASAKVVLFFYAGHGMQVSGRNYLIPIDAKLEDKTALDFEAIDVDKVFQYMTGEDKIALAFLDACRNNPLARTFARSLGVTRSTAVGNGLAPTSTSGSGLFIAYATAPNDVALDGDGRNSPFTNALLRNLPTPNLEIQQVMTRVKADVQQQTGGRQRPWHNSDLGTEVFLASAPADGPTPSPVVTDPSTILWNAIADTDDLDTLQLFLSRFPQSRHAAEARLRIAALNPNDKPVDTPPQPQGDALAARDECRRLTRALEYVIDESITVEVDPKDIIAACERAAQLNLDDGEVYYWLGLAYQNYLTYSDPKRLHANARSAEAGFINGAVSHAYNLIWRSSRGGIGYDPWKAESLLLKLNPEENYKAAYALSSVYEHSPPHFYRGVSIKDPGKAIYFARRAFDLAKQAADSGEMEATAYLASMYHYGREINSTEVVKRDMSQATVYYRRAAEQGYALAHSQLLGIAADQPSLFTDAERAELRAAFITAASELFRRGTLFAGYQLGDYYQRWEKDTRKAITAYQEAAMRGSTISMNSLVQIYESAEARDPEAARHWREQHIAHTSSCESAYEAALDMVNPEIEQLATQEAAAKCYLMAQAGSSIGDYYNGQTMAFSFRNVSPAARRAIQTVLKQVGFYRGPIDGKFGNGTAAAYRQFRNADPMQIARALGVD